MNTEPGVAVVPNQTQDACVGRCPECSWRDGPFEAPGQARAALMRHVQDKHKGLVALLRPGYSTLPEFNEHRAQGSVKLCLNQAIRIEQAMQASPILGPNGEGATINVPAEMVQFMKSASLALSSVLDLLLEMRTGHAALKPAPPQPHIRTEEHARRAG